MHTPSIPVTTYPYTHHQHTHAPPPTTTQPLQEIFKQAVARQHGLMSANHLKGLSRARIFKEDGLKAAKDHLDFFLQVAPGGKISQAGNYVSKFVNDVKASEACAEELPVLVMYNMNTMDARSASTPAFWQQRLDALKTLLVSKPSTTMGIIIHRKMCPNGREQFRSQVAKHAEEGGINTEGEVVLSYQKHGVGQSQRVCIGWLALPALTDGGYAFAKSDIMGGSVTIAASSTTKDLVPVSGTGKAGDVSALQRQQYWPVETYTTIVREAARGANLPKSKDGLPLLVLVIFDPFNGTALHAALSMQKQAKHPQGHSADAIDIRAICFPSSEEEQERLADDLIETVARAWCNGELNVDGHKISKQVDLANSSDTAATATSPLALDIATLDEHGHFTLPEKALHAFLTDETTRERACAFIASLKAEYLHEKAPVIRTAPPKSTAMEVANNLPKVPGDPSSISNSTVLK